MTNAELRLLLALLEDDAPVVLAQGADVVEIDGALIVASLVDGRALVVLYAGEAPQWEPAGLVAA